MPVKKPDGRAGFNCTGKDCLHWNTRKCLSCEAYLSFQLISKPAPNICRYPQEFIEEFTPDDSRIKSVFDCLTHMPAFYATLILQRHILKMSLQELSALHRIRKATMSQKINEAHTLLNALLGTAQFRR